MCWRPRLWVVTYHDGQQTRPLLKREAKDLAAIFGGTIAPERREDR